MSKFRPQVFIGFVLIAGLAGAAMYFSQQEIALMTTGGLIASIKDLLSKE